MVRDLHVFYAGPGVCGAERNIELLAAWAPADRRPTPFQAFAHRGERYEHASFLRSDGAVRIHAYSRSSSLYAPEHVDAMLVALAHVIVLVVDARDFRIDAAIDRRERLDAIARGVGASATPWLGQLNRSHETPGRVSLDGTERDARYVALDEVRGRVLPEGTRWVEARTYDGTGVVDTLRAAVSLVPAGAEERPPPPEVQSVLAR